MVRSLYRDWCSILNSHSTGTLAKNIVNDVGSHMIAIHNLWAFLVTVQTNQGYRSAASAAKSAMKMLWVKVDPFRLNTDTKIVSWKRLFTIANIFVIGSRLPCVFSGSAYNPMKKTLIQFAKSHLLLQISAVLLRTDSEQGQSNNFLIWTQVEKETQM